MIGCLPTQALAFGWKPGFSLWLWMHMWCYESVVQRVIMWTDVNIVMKQFYSQMTMQPDHQSWVNLIWLPAPWAYTRDGRRHKCRIPPLAYRQPRVPYLVIKWKLLRNSDISVVTSTRLENGLQLLQCSCQWVYVTVSVWSDFCLHEHHYRVCYTTVRSIHLPCSTGIQSTFQPATSATWPHPRVVHGIHRLPYHTQWCNPQDLGQQCWLAATN